jgi:hypothetical protein
MPALPALLPLADARSPPGGGGGAAPASGSPALLPARRAPRASNLASSPGLASANLTAMGCEVPGRVMLPTERSAASASAHVLKVTKAQPGER